MKYAHIKRTPLNHILFTVTHYADEMAMFKPKYKIVSRENKVNKKKILSYVI